MRTPNFYRIPAVAVNTQVVFQIPLTSVWQKIVGVAWAYTNQGAGALMPIMAIGRVGGDAELWVSSGPRVALFAAVNCSAFIGAHQQFQSGDLVNAEVANFSLPDIWTPYQTVLTLTASDVLTAGTIANPGVWVCYAETEEELW